MSASPTERFRRVDAVFDAVLDLPANEQTAYIERACAHDPEMRTEVLRLLRAHRLSDKLLDLPAIKIGAPLLEDTDLFRPSRAPERVGVFRITREIGRGGMGQVFLGERDDGQFEQRVAIKLIQHGAPGLVRRFLEERRILAMLEHPNIARLIDGGITDDGLPYFAMELVDGEPIDRYCDAHQLSLEKRLALFADVCDAVAYAHHQLVIHRDLKPSNILVTADGAVKLLDFGIATLLPSGDADDVRTHTMFTALTPDFAAPEQVRGESVNTATDVYALGVLLYVLMTGVRPYDVRGKSPAAVERTICETDPAKPSGTVALALEEAAPQPTAAERAQMRGLTPERLRRRLQGDIDAITLRALRKEPELRYASAEAFARDVRRFFSGRPVTARPPTFRYHARKFIARNRTVAAAGVLSALTLVIAIVATSAGMLEAQRQRDEAREQRDRAVYQEQRATAASGFMQTLLQSVAPSGRPYTTIELLERARALLEQDFHADPRFVARMMVELSAHYVAIGDVTRQLSLLTRAAELAARSEDAETAAQAQCGIALIHASREDVAPARAQLASGLRNLAGVTAPAVRARMQCMLAQAQLAIEDGFGDSALVLAHQAVNLAETTGDTASVAFADALATMTVQLHNQNRVRDALNANRRIVTTLERIGRGSTLPMLEARTWDARYLRDLGEIRAADSVLQDVMRMAGRIDPEYLGTNISILAGEIAAGLGRSQDAVAAYQRAIADARSSNDAFREQWARERLVAVLADDGELPRARAAMAELEAMIPGRDRDRAALRMLHARLADAHADAGRARGLYLQVLAEIGFPDGPDAAPWHRIVYRAARASLAAGDAVAADTLARHALRLERSLGHDETRSGDMGLSFLIIAQARRAANDHGGARQALQRALPALEYGLGAQHPATAEARKLSSQ